MTQAFQKVDKIPCAGCGTKLDVRNIEPFASIKCPKCEKKTTVPAEMGKFRLLRILGEGTMGSVYEGLDRTLHRTVAIKVIRDNLSEDEALIDSCLKEARAQAAISHNNIVKVYSVAETNGLPYIVMELVTGKKLEKLLAKRKRLDESFVLDIAIGIAEGLAIATKANLVHGDIKPANIMLDDENNPKLTDFGIARRSEGDVDGLGTPFYIAPEVAKRQHCDLRSDIYSFGATLYHLIIGQPPFVAENPSAVVMARFKKPATYLREIDYKIHPETANVIARMLAFKIHDRYQDYDTLIEDLKAAKAAVLAGPVDADMEAMQAAYSSARTSKTNLGKRARKNGKKKSNSTPVMMVLSCIGVVALLGLAIFLLSGGNNDAVEKEDPNTVAMAGPVKNADTKQSDIIPEPVKDNTTQQTTNERSTTDQNIEPKSPEKNNTPDTPDTPDTPQTPDNKVPKIEEKKLEPEPEVVPDNKQEVDPKPKKDESQKKDPPKIKPPTKSKTLFPGAEFIVHEGETTIAMFEGKKWENVERQLTAPDTNEKLHLPVNINNSNFHIKMQLTWSNISRSGAAIVLNHKSTIVFNDMKTGKMAVQGPIFGKPQQLSQLSNPEKELVVELIRKDDILRILVDDILVYLMPDPGIHITSIGFQTGRAGLAIKNVAYKTY